MQLQQALTPELEDALEVMKCMEKREITELKSLVKPPALVSLIMEAVSVLFGVTDISWSSSQKLLGNRQFFETILNYDKDNISPATIKKLQPYIKHPDFNVVKASSVSKASAGLC